MKAAANNNHNIPSSNLRYSSNLENFQSNFYFKSSTDILRLLAEDPDYQKMPPSILDAIVAAIISGAILLGSVALLVVTGMSGMPVVAGCLGFVANSAGMALNYSITGIITKKFSLSEMFASSLNPAITLITIAGGVVAGSLIGLALVGAKLSETAIKVIGSIAGAILGSGIKSGSYVLIKKVLGRSYFYHSFQIPLYITPRVNKRDHPLD
jgi:hypothetical protein